MILADPFQLNYYIVFFSFLSYPMSVCSLPHSKKAPDRYVQQLLVFILSLDGVCLCSKSSLT